MAAFVTSVPFFASRAIVGSSSFVTTMPSRIKSSSSAAAAAAVPSSRRRSSTHEATRRSKYAPAKHGSALARPTAKRSRPLMSAATPSSTKDLVKKAIQGNSIMVFSKSRCPYCAQAKALLQNDLGLKITVWELDQMSNGSDIQSELLSVTGQRTVPNIFIDKEHIGGCDDLMAAHASGELKKKLKA